MTLFLLLQSDAAVLMTSCCIFGISGISCITASVLTVISVCSCVWERSSCRDDLPLEYDWCTFSYLLLGLRRLLCLSRRKKAFPQLHISRLLYIHMFHRQLCVKWHFWTVALPASLECRHTHSHTHTPVFTKTTGIACWGFWRPLLDAGHTHSSYPRLLLVPSSAGALCHPKHARMCVCVRVFWIFHVTKCVLFS